jgi:hypothetical protein
MPPPPRRLIVAVAALFASASLAAAASRARSAAVARAVCALTSAALTASSASSLRTSLASCSDDEAFAAAFLLAFLYGGELLDRGNLAAFVFPSLDRGRFRFWSSAGAHAISVWIFPVRAAMG